MFGRSWKVGSLGGIPIRVDSSWIFIFAFMTYSLWVRATVSHPFIAGGQAVALGVLGSLLFFGTILLHELSHAIAARARGLRVVDITLVFFGGFTNTNTEERGPGAEFLVAAVGPASTLVIGGLFLASGRITGWSGTPLSETFHFLGQWSLLIGAFNLLPGFPLDGGRMLRAGVWGATGNLSRATMVAAAAGLAVGILLIAGGVLQASRGDLGTGVWITVMGWWIISAARGSQQRERMRARLSGGTVSYAMGPPPTAIPAELTLSEALDRYLRGHETESFPVAEAPAIAGFAPSVVGVLTFRSASDVGRIDPLRPVREAAIPMAEVLSVAPETGLAEALDRLGGGRAALVLRDGELVGQITQSDIASWASSQRV